MSDDMHCDALVLFGAAGDLAFKKIFPALYAMSKRGSLHCKIIAVVRRETAIAELRTRIRDSIARHGDVIESAAFEWLIASLSLVSGDYESPETFRSIGNALGEARRPAFYLAIPPALFESVVARLAVDRTAAQARVVLEKPFGRNLASARELNRLLLESFNEQQIFRIDHYLGKRPVYNLALFRHSNTLIDAFWNREHIESVQITMAESFGVRGRGAFFDQTGTIRDVVQNHLLQLVANLAMESPIREDSESRRDETAKVLKSIDAVEPNEVVRGQFRGYREEAGVATASEVETYVALRLNLDSQRWAGVPFYIRAGKALPVTCTEVVVRLRRPIGRLPIIVAQPNYFRFRISPDTTMAMGINVMDGDERGVGETRELLASRHAGTPEMDAYERVLTDALTGDQTLFARQDHVEEAWRIVNPLLSAHSTTLNYEPGTWGPVVAHDPVLPAGGWQNPEVSA